MRRNVGSPVAQSTSTGGASLRTHTVIGVAAIGLSALAFVALQAPPASASALEICCGGMGDCPEGYKCCKQTGDECSPTREGFCSTLCAANGDVR